MSRTIRLRNKNHEIFTSNYEREYVNDVYAHHTKDFKFAVDVDKEHKERKEWIQYRRTDLQRDNKHVARSIRGYSRVYHKKERADMRGQLYRTLQDPDYVVVDKSKKFSSEFYWFIVD